MPIRGLNLPPSHLEIFINPRYQKSDRPNTHDPNWLLDQLDSLRTWTENKTRENGDYIFFFHFINYESLLKKRTPAIMKEI